MKKVVNASVGGRSFSFDDDAYARLVAYFDHFKARLNKDSKAAEDEVMSDLENRIAELFDGKRPVGVRVCSSMHKIKHWELPRELHEVTLELKFRSRSFLQFRRSL